MHSTTARRGLFDNDRKDSLAMIYGQSRARAYIDALEAQFNLGISFLAMLLVVLCIFFFIMIFCPELYAAGGTKLPGSDASDKLEAAGTILRLIDTGLFKWGARIFTGVCVMAAGWAIKEQRFGTAIICIVGALLFGTTTMWVKNIFEISGGDSVFGANTPSHLIVDPNEAPKNV